MTHAAALCPALPFPNWRPMTSPGLRRRAAPGARDFDRRAFWMAANQAIELAYAADHPGHVVLYGRDFASEGPSGTVLLPRGVPDAARMNRLLQQLRGLSNQRKPDIIDFTDRTMYEIKPAGSDVAVGLVQGQSPIAVANAIAVKEGLDPWHLDMCTWTPPHVLPYPTDPLRRVCTGETDAVAARGLILYRVYRRASEEKERRYNQQTAVLTDLVTELRSERRRLGVELERVASRFEPDTDLWILCPVALWETLVLRPRDQARPWPGTVDIRRYPLMAGHAAMAAAVVSPLLAAARLFSDERVLIVMAAAAVCLVVIGVGVLLAPEAAVGGAVVAATTETAVATQAAVVAEEAVVISLQAYRAARAAQAVAASAKQTSAAAAALLVVVSTRQAAAQTTSVVQNVTAVRAVDADDMPSYYEYEKDREVVYQGEPYRIIGRARVAGAAASP